MPRTGGAYPSRKKHKKGGGQGPKQPAAQREQQQRRAAAASFSSDEDNPFHFPDDEGEGKRKGRLSVQAAMVGVWVWWG